MYRIGLKNKAKKFIDGLPQNERLRVVAAIEQLPNGEDIEKLKGHADLLRLCVGTYRIIYTVDNGELVVYAIKFCVSVFRQSQEWRWKAGRILA